MFEVPDSFWFAIFMLKVLTEISVSPSVACVVTVWSESAAGTNRVKVDVAHLCLTSDALFMFSFWAVSWERVWSWNEGWAGPDFGGGGSGGFQCCRRSDLKTSELEQVSKLPDFQLAQRSGSSTTRRRPPVFPCPKYPLTLLIFFFSSLYSIFPCIWSPQSRNKAWADLLDFFWRPGFSGLHCPMMLIKGVALIRVAELRWGVLIGCTESLCALTCPHHSHPNMNCLGFAQIAVQSLHGEVFVIWISGCHCQVEWAGYKTFCSGHQEEMISALNTQNDFCSELTHRIHYFTETCLSSFPVCWGSLMSLQLVSVEEAWKIIHRHLNKCWDDGRWPHHPAHQFINQRIKCGCQLETRLYLFSLSLSQL